MIKQAQEVKPKMKNKFFRSAVGRPHLLPFYFLVTAGLFFLLTENAFAYTDEQIAQAIYLAEGGANTKYPYGILTKYKTTTPKQACLNTIRNHRVRHANHDCGKDFITCLGNRYCPVGASNDPTGLNKNWVRNVKHLLAKEGR